MATKTFSINTQPHVADVGGTELLFQPEVMGDDFMDAYAELSNTQQNSGVDLDDLQGTDPAQLRVAARALRTFLAELMLPESAELFTRLDVVRDGKVLKSFSDRDEAEKYAEDNPGSRVVDALRLPDRVLVELLEWAVELFGGGKRPPTSSGGSASKSTPPGTRGTGASRSMGQTRTRGR
ncbi:hypothetical protein [Streptomyces niveus]|uniref:hypothetical protein n=1 Tax=Streptomyces niveus TaxID=193462 RepID=UPI0036CF104B